MTKGRRVNEEAVDIDYKSTQAFFDARGLGSYINPLSATMYQDEQPELVEKRDVAEKATLASFPGISCVESVLDMGCGIGRWAKFFADQTQPPVYLGIDFSASLIEKAKKINVKNEKKTHFQVMSVTELEEKKLIVPPPYEFVIISGVLMYLNDNDCLQVLKKAVSLCAKNGRIYLREPLAISVRLTLQDVFSEELNYNYSAIYRTEDELNEIIKKACADDVFYMQPWKKLFSDDLEKRKETRQKYSLLCRSETL
ncbi:class I SAM-dependent methyltransferase [Erwinia oleae]|uniref:class I SAM-dependent methyltransferase n=1 Tax=Erwinia oleae TaxID=796334 RepID=UPI0005567C9B|nr:class I SAM-dependent methyltransferase [Erwinia oleae]